MMFRPFEKKHLHQPGKSAGVLAINISYLMKILREQLLHHQFDSATETMETVVMAMDKTPEIVRKVGIEVLLHGDPECSYGAGLKLYKHLFTKQYNHREEVLLEMSLFIAKNGNLEEAYETIHSQVSSEPFKSNPLFRGYCGLYQYLLWEQEVELQKEKYHSTKSPVHSKQNQRDRHSIDDSSSGWSSSEDDSDSEMEQSGPTESLKAKAYSKQALAHFDTLGRMEMSKDDNLDYFVLIHHKLLVALNIKDRGLQVLFYYRTKLPHRITINRLICDHLRVHCFKNIDLRIEHLTMLVELDESCEEVIELVQLLLDKETVAYNLCHKLILHFLDYPSNGDKEIAWDLLKRIQSSWPESVLTDKWTTRVSLWEELYPDQICAHVVRNTTSN